jgi:hypothetical protein
MSVLCQFRKSSALVASVDPQTLSWSLRALFPRESTVNLATVWANKNASSHATRPSFLAPLETIRLGARQRPASGYPSAACEVALPKFASTIKTMFGAALMKIFTHEF